MKTSATYTFKSVATALCAGLTIAVVTRTGSAVGGDTCANPTIVTNLPYFDSGNTCSFQDDYDELCPFGAPGSPDVVYAYTPAQTEYLEVSLCADSTYDTRLWIYESACGNSLNLIACNDDLCGLVSNARFAATGTLTYYIVVDGYAGDCGDYTIEVLEASPPDCPPGTMFGQPPYIPTDQWSFGVSDIDYDVPGGVIRYENFSVTGPICEVRWAGVKYGSGGPCFETPMLFDVTFYYDNGGALGAVACSNTVWLPGIPTGIYYGYVGEMYRWDLDLRPLQCCTLESGWISIQALDDPGCLFWWAGADFGDGESLIDEGLGLQTQSYDLAMCLIGDLGACCFDGGECIEALADDCLSAGGVYLGDRSSCELGCAPPPNDHCETAALLGVPSEVFASNALADGDETPPCGTDAPHQGVWYAVEGTGGMLQASTRHPGTGFDTMIQVFCDCFEYVCVDANDDAFDPACDLHGDRVLSTVEWCSEFGKLYFIKVGGFASETGHFQLTVSEIGSCGPPVDCEPPVGRCCFFESCPWDCANGDGVVDVVDLLAMLGQWGGPGGCDLNETGAVDVVDLLELLGHWGPCVSDLACAETTPAHCAELGGVWTEGVTCDIPCPIAAAH